MLELEAARGESDLNLPGAARARMRMQAQTRVQSIQLLSSRRLDPRMLLYRLDARLQERLASLPSVGTDCEMVDEMALVICSCGAPIAV